MNRLRWLLRFYPARFRRDWGEEYIEFLRRQRCEPRYEGRVGALRFWLEATSGALLGGLRKRAEGPHGSRGESHQGPGSGSGWGPVLQDLRYAARGLRRAPLFTLAAVATLALALGANSAVFSIVNGTLLAPLPYPDADRLVALWNDIPAMEWYERPVGRWVWEELERSGTAFEAVTATRPARVNLLTDGDPVVVDALRATATIFQVFGVVPALGREFTEAEDRPGADGVAMIGYGFWQSAFGGDPDIVGRRIETDGLSREVVGVLGPDFVAPRGAVDLILPLAADRSQPAPMGVHDHFVYARLGAGIGAAEAHERMESFNVAFRDLWPQIDLERFGFRVYWVPLADDLTSAARPALSLLMGAVVLILLVACANVSNLTLGRSEQRRRERSVRLVLGSGRRGIARLAAIESVILALAGAAFGTGLAWSSIQLVDRLPPDLLPPTAVIEFDGGGLLFNSLTALFAMVVIGVLPALHLLRETPADALRAGGRGSADAGRAWVRGALVASQVALSVFLLVGAALLGRSFLAVTAVDPGFNPPGLLTFDIQLPRARYASSTETSSFAGRLTEQIQSAPGVVSAGIADRMPLAAEFSTSAFRITDRDDAEFGGVAPDTYWHVVGRNFLPTLGVPLVQGELWSAADGPESPTRIVVNRAFADAFFPDGSPLGERAGLLGTEHSEIIGVVGDTYFNGPTGANGPMIYYLLDQWWSVIGSVDAWADPYEDRASVPFSVAVRTDGNAAAVAPLVRRRLTAVDPTIPMTNVRTMTSLVDASVAQPRLLLALIAGFAGIGLALAALGTYAVLSYGVSARSREMGIRLALGSTPEQLRRLTTWGGLQIAVVGVALGIGGAMTLSGLLQGLLYEVEPTDPASYVVVVGSVLVVSVLASWMPALRASKTDPIEAMRAE